MTFLTLRYLLCCIAILLQVQVAYTQCPDSEIILKKQEDLAEFLIAYPNCTEIQSDLIITRSSDSLDIQDLSGLSNITSIKGDLTITLNRFLLNLSGLENLTSIEGALEIRTNDTLTSLVALSNLKTVKETLTITGNRYLTSLEGLENLDLNELMYRLNITNNNRLAICDFENICAFLAKEGNAYFGSNALSCNEINTVKSLCVMEGLCPEKTVTITSQADITLYKELFSDCTNLLSLVINGADIVEADLTAFEQVQRIEENLEVSNTTLLEDLSSLSGIQGLKKISIQNNDTLTILPILTDIEALEALTISNNRNLSNLKGFDNLKKVDHLRLVRNNSLESLLSLGALEEVRRILLIDRNPALTNFEGLNNLKTIGTFNIWQNNSLKDLTALSQVKTMNQLFIANNPRLGSLVGLEGLENLNILHLNNNPLLSDLSSLATIKELSRLQIRNCPSLKNLEGLGDLEQVADFIIEQNNSLLNLQGLNSINTISAIQIGKNKNLQSLSGLETLKETWAMTIFENPSLVDISAINILDNQAMIFDVTIFNNKNLATCRSPFICNYLINGGAGTFSKNATGCRSIEEIKSQCAEGLSQIEYSIFYDTNENGIKEAEEVYYADASLLITPLNSTLYPRPNQSTTFLLENGTYDITLQLENPSHWDFTSSPQTVVVTLSPDAPVANISFGIAPKVDSIAVVSAINLSNTRCNTEGTITLDVKNSGTVPIEGIVWLTIDSSIVDWNLIDQPDTILQDFSVGWEFTNLFPGSSIAREIRGTVLGPPTYAFTTPIQLSSYLLVDSIENKDTLGRFEFLATRRCSYDPNDKLVQPNRPNNLVLFEEPFTYTIRFQNTGNAEALDILILDTLDHQLDAATFKLISSSHSEVLSTSINEEGIISFNFSHINLPDSTSNLEASQGYITYSIEEHDQLEEGTSITNTASIYFDKNPPIITNTTESILVSDLFIDSDGDGFKSNLDCDDSNPDIFPDATEIANNGIDEDCDGADLILTSWETEAGNPIIIYPNPTTALISIQQNYASSLQIQLYTITGQALLHRTASSQLTVVDIMDLPRGIYILEIKEATTGLRLIEKIIKE